jgi:hypothetical protein
MREFSNLELRQACLQRDIGNRYLDRGRKKAKLTRRLSGGKTGPLKNNLGGSEEGHLPQWTSINDRLGEIGAISAHESNARISLSFVPSQRILISR